MRRLLWLIPLLLCLVVVEPVVATNITVTADPNYATAAPNVTASNATDITNTSGMLHGNVTDNHGGTITMWGFEWGLSAGNYSLSWNQTGTWLTGTFNHTITSLSLDTEYFWRAFAENDVGRGNSTELSFTTLGIPTAPTDFVITQISGSSVNITWTMGVGANQTLIIGNDQRYPSDREDGYVVYNGTGTWVNESDLDLTLNTYYRRAWSWNDNGFSPDYAQDSIGGGNMALLIFMILPLGLLGFWLKWRIGFLAYGSAGTWFLLAILAMQTSGGANPTEIVDIYMALFWMGVAFTIGMALLPTVMREKPEAGDVYVDQVDIAGDDVSSIMPEETEKEEPEKKQGSRKFDRTGRM